MILTTFLSWFPAMCLGLAALAGMTIGRLVSDTLKGHLIGLSLGTLCGLAIIVLILYCVSLSGFDLQQLHREL
ncbi:hypothetical protein, partial [Erwinia mallotivora]